MFYNFFFPWNVKKARSSVLPCRYSGWDSPVVPHTYSTKNQVNRQYIWAQSSSYYKLKCLSLYGERAKTMTKTHNKAEKAHTTNSKSFNCVRTHQSRSSSINFITSTYLFILICVTSTFISSPLMFIPNFVFCIHLSPHQCGGVHVAPWEQPMYGSCSWWDQARCLWNQQ